MIYLQTIEGTYRTRKNLASIILLLIYFCGSWIRWSRGVNQTTQAIYMDLVHRKAYLFFIEIWPEELYYLAGILIMAALGLFFVTTLYGRIWCGYTCPHTVFVDLFVKVETFFQGDRNARVRLDVSSMTRDKLVRKLSTHAVWLLIAFMFAFGWVCYFYDAPTLVGDIIRFQVTWGGLSWLLGLTVSTYLFAGFIRERVCLYMCPYGRFQSAMLDNDTSVVTYHTYRGEPRGKSADSGDCIDCSKCVVVCPMGIDIRDGLQLACIGCGLCIDACNSVMEKIGKAPYLIGYDSANSSKMKELNQQYKPKRLRAKIILFGGVFLVVMGVLFYSLSHKEVVRIAILHERSAMFTVLPDGSLRNGYTLKVFNHSAQLQRFELKIEGIEGALIKTQGFAQEYLPTQQLEIPAEQERELLVFIKVEKDKLKSGKNDVTFKLINLETEKMYTVSSIFIGN